MSHVLLIGFMGAGKSRVGRMLAKRLGLGFVDLDTLIEQREDATVSALFESGEGTFRDAEHDALRSLSDAPDSVVACGGGIVVRDENRALLRSLGRVVYLAVSADEALARIGDTTGRPLLAGDGAKLAPQILSARLALYRAAGDYLVDTSGRSAEEVLEEVLMVLQEPDPGSSIRVASSAGYDVLVGSGVLANIGERVKATTGAKRVAVVSDTNVAPLYSAQVVESLDAAGLSSDLIVIEAGERSKDWDNAGTLVSRFAEDRLGRDGAVVALGGGVVGDLAGFAAAVYVRGIPVVQVPTSLLAQVDSSIGGKTGVDLPQGKNLAGAFWQPAAVISDTSVLLTLPDAEWTSGLVEVAKSALLAGENETARLEADALHLLSRDHVAVQDAVRMAAGFKAGIVSGDERESGDRECLNLGHTLGHALERELGYGTISHGAAVGIGMRFAARLAEEVLGASSELTGRTEALLEALGASTRAPQGLNAENLLDSMFSDKKNRGGAVRFVLLRAPGDWRVVPVETDVIARHLEWWLRGE